MRIRCLKKAVSTPCFDVSIYTRLIGANFNTIHVHMMNISAYSVYIYIYIAGHSVRSGDGVDAWGYISDMHALFQSRKAVGG